MTQAQVFPYQKCQQFGVFLANSVLPGKEPHVLFA